MLKEMIHPKYDGNALRIDLSNLGYPNYIVECAYHFDKKTEKYSLSMWLLRTDVEDRMKLSSKKIDTQYIYGTKETIVENVCKVVHYCATVINENDGKKFFDYFVERYEYELECFERGDELFKAERLTKLNADKQ